MSSRHATTIYLIYALSINSEVEGYPYRDNYGILLNTYKEMFYE